jgi:hypothetical protein
MAGVEHLAPVKAVPGTKEYALAQQALFVRSIAERYFQRTANMPQPIPDEHSRALLEEVMAEREAEHAASMAR